MRAVGYRQVWETLEGRSRGDAREPRHRRHAQLAKRQLTWLGDGMPGDRRD
jgi:tRNA A37 N6-isopentenylltransferase MiaA